MHPFCLHLKPCRSGEGRFVWEINQRGRPKRHFPHSYPTFEAARKAAKAKLDALIADWRQSPAGTGAPDVIASASRQVLLPATLGSRCLRPVTPCEGDFAGAT